MSKSDLRKGIEQGFGFFGIGLILFTIIIGVYAFVEPTNGPTSNFVLNWNSPFLHNINNTNEKINNVSIKLDDLKEKIDNLSSQSSGSVTFAGITSTAYNGNLGGAIGANDKCNAQYPGSRAMNYHDWLVIGYSSTQIWILDGSYTIGTHQVTRDGGLSTTTGDVLHPMCGGWNQQTSGYSGPVTLGSRIVTNNCANSFRLGCVYD